MERVQRFALFSSHLKNLDEDNGSISGSEETSRRLTVPIKEPIDEGKLKELFVVPPQMHRLVFPLQKMTTMDEKRRR